MKRVLLLVVCFLVALCSTTFPSMAVADEKTGDAGEQAPLTGLVTKGVHACFVEDSCTSIEKDACGRPGTPVLVDPEETWERTSALQLTQIKKSNKVLVCHHGDDTQGVPYFEITSWTLPAGRVRVEKREIPLAVHVVFLLMSITLMALGVMTYFMGKEFRPFIITAAILVAIVSWLFTSIGTEYFANGAFFPACFLASTRGHSDYEKKEVICLTTVFLVLVMVVIIV